jgi:hypothetical protein
MLFSESIAQHKHVKAKIEKFSRENFMVLGKYPVVSY